MRLQVGFSYGIYDFMGRESASVRADEVQGFLTYGFYRRSDVNAGKRVCWAVVVDSLAASEWGFFADNLGLGQCRGIIGYAINPSNELGLWGVFVSGADRDNPYGVLRPSHQYNLYWRHNFDFGGQGLLYFDGLDGSSVGSWVFGLLGQAPLSNYLGLYGSFVMAQPKAGAGPIGYDDQEWAASFGVSWYLGAKAVSPTVSGRKGLPLLPVANNGSFLITN